MTFFKRLLFGPPSVDRTAKQITWKVAKSSFKIFRDKEVRRLLNFSELATIEQDRIFNELVLSGLAIAYLMAEMLAKFYSADNFEELRDFVKEVKEKLLYSYSEILADKGIEEKYTKLWVELMQMRTDEYRQDWHDYRNDLPNPEKQNPWVPVVAVGALNHIRRGKTTPDDPLFEIVYSWIGDLSGNISDILARALRRL